MIKHWLTDHAELPDPPNFRMKVVGSYKDAQSRQLSGSVRIDLSGAGVLNSKTEYSRCRIPCLVVEIEEWKRNKSEMKTLLETLPIPGEGLVDEENMTSKEDVQPAKRKNENSGPKSKKKRLEPLVEWGEGEVESSVWKTWLELDESSNRRSDWLKRKDPDYFIFIYLFSTMV